MLQELLYREMHAEMRRCINKEDIKAGLPFRTDSGYDMEHIFIFWQQFRVKVDNLNKYIEGLDYDIAARVPWGDVEFNSNEGFVEGLPITRYWTATKDCFEANRNSWNEAYNINIASAGEHLYFFTTSTDKDTEIVMEGAEEAQICPSPASTLIMLQTRAKDKLKIEKLKMSDFAVEHYRQVEAALGLKDTIPNTKRKRFLFRIRKIFRR